MNIDEFRAEARAWLASVAEPRPADGGWGTGDDSVAVFENWTAEQERYRGFGIESPLLTR